MAGDDHGALMRRNSTPSIVPESGDQNVCLVKDDLGRLSRVVTNAVK
jgi:hypothetical protein